MPVAIMILFFALVIAMPIAMALVLAASILTLLWMLVAWLLSWPRRRRSARLRLPDSWWVEFEREFHAYNEPDLTRARQQEQQL